MKAPLCLLVSFASLPLLSAAQTTPANPKFYVGLGASVLTNVVFRPSSSYTPAPALVGPALTLGRQFTPRLGAQLSVAYAWQTVGNPNGEVFSAYQVRNRVFSAPLLLRYSLLSATNRFQVDALAGVTIQHASESYDFHFIPAATNYPDTFSGTSSTTYVNLTLGPAIRYSLTPQWELSATPLVLMRLGENYSTFRNRLFWQALVGVNYTFGQ